MTNAAVGLACVFLALFLWGTWPVTIKHAKSLKIGEHGLHENPDDPSFSIEFYFIGFSLGVILSSFLVLHDLVQEEFFEKPSSFFKYSFLAGAIANMGKIANCYAIDWLGMTVSHSLVMGIDVGLGTLLLYVMNPSVNPTFLFTGVAFVMIGVAWDILSTLQAGVIDPNESEETESLLEKRMEEYKKELSRKSKKDDTVDDEETDSNWNEAGSPLPYLDTALSSITARVSQKHMKLHRQMSMTSRHFNMAASTPRLSTQRQSAVFLDTTAARLFLRAGLLKSKKNLLEETEVVSTGPGDVSMDQETSHVLSAEPPPDGICISIAIAIFAGVALGGWPLICEQGLHHDLITWKQFFYGWTLGLGLMSFFTLPALIFIRKPSLDSLDTHTILYGILGGFAMSTGIFLMFVSHSQLHFVVSMTIVRCNPLISAFWGLFWFGEFDEASTTAKVFISLSLLFYMSAIGLVVCSIMFTKTEPNNSATSPESLFLPFSGR